MKLHLVRLAKRQGQARFPGLEGFCTLLMEKPQEIEGPRLYVLLEGELVIDLPDHSYLHLRKGEGAHLQGPHKITPIDPSVVAVWNP